MARSVRSIPVSASPEASIQYGHLGWIDPLTGRFVPSISGGAPEEGEGEGEGEGEREGEEGEAKPDPRDAEIAELRASLAQTSGQIAQMNENFNAVLANQNAGNKAPVVEEKPPTVEEIEAALAAGEAPAPLIAKLIAHSTAAVAKDFEGKLAEVSTRVNTFGLGAISEHAKHIALLSKDDKGNPKLKYYDRFKKEIDVVVAKMPTEAQLSPDSVVGAHQYVVGQHHEEIIEEEVEARLRARGGDTNQDAGGAGGPGRKNAKGTHVPTAEEIFGPDAAVAVKEKGGEDAFAKSLGSGYESWEDYLQKTGHMGTA